MVFDLDKAYEFICKLHDSLDDFQFQVHHDKPAPSSFSSINEKAFVDLPDIQQLLLQLNDDRLFNDLEKVSLLFWLSYGFQSIRVPLRGFSPSLIKPQLYPQRAIASGGACYPMQLYLYAPESSLCLFRYAPNFHALSVEKNSILGCGYNKTVIFISLLFERTCFKYQPFAYRLSAVDAGGLLSRLVHVLTMLNWKFEIDFDFDGVAIDSALGFEAREEATYAVISIASYPEISSLMTHKPLLSTTHVAQDDTFFIPDVVYHMHRFVHAINTQHCFGNMIQSRALSNQKFELPHLIKAIQKRSSLARYFLSEQADEKILFDCLAQSLAILEEIKHSCLGKNLPTLEIYGVVLNVNGVENGCYHFDKTTYQLKLTNAAVSAFDVTNCLYVRSANIGLSAFIIHVAGHLDFRYDFRGAKAYRIQQMLVGAVIDRVGITASSAGLSAHPFLGFSAKKLLHLYGDIPEDLVILGQICVGKAAYSNNYVPMIANF